MQGALEFYLESLLYFLICIALILFFRKSLNLTPKHLRLWESINGRHFLGFLEYTPTQRTNGSSFCFRRKHDSEEV